MSKQLWGTKMSDFEQYAPDAFLAVEGVGVAKGDIAGVRIIQLNKIKLSKNSRHEISDEELDGLMQSIKSVGLLQPIGVTKNGPGYEICYGNRRFLACSRLGLSRIAAVVHNGKKEFDREIKNLTENIQRRNIGLAEAGRYIALLKKEGLKSKEIAVRLGVSASYIEHCSRAFEHVPAEYRGDLEIKVSSEKLAPGKISMKTASAILNAEKSYRLSAEETKALFKAAKTQDKFSVESVPKYASALKSGKKNFLKAVEPTKHVRVNFIITEDHFLELEKKFVDDGPFNSVPALCVAILKGEKAVKVDIKGRY